MAGRRGFQQYTEQQLLDALQQEVTERAVYRRVPRRWGELNAQQMARRGFAQLQSQAAVTDAWQKTVGQQIAQLSRPGRLRAQVLDVLVSSSVLSQQLTMQKLQILATFNRLLAATVSDHREIRDIRCRVDATLDATRIT